MMSDPAAPPLTLPTFVVNFNFRAARGACSRHELIFTPLFPVVLVLFTNPRYV